MDNGPQILTAIRDIGSLEGDADDVLRSALSKLFREEPDVRQLIKLKEFYESLEMVTDYCDDVGTCSKRSSSKLLRPPPWSI